MIKVRSVRERYEIQERCLKERLERIVPQAMEQSGADIWLHVSREYNEDPTFRALFPPMYPTARRLTILAFVKTDEGVRRFHAVSYTHLDVYKRQTERHSYARKR